MSVQPALAKHYAALATMLRTEVDEISVSIKHRGEQGANNEMILGEFLRKHLPKRYSVDTGKVISCTGEESKQIDVIIHDRHDSPAFVAAKAFHLVPVETVRAVIPVKTTLTSDELRDALDNIQSVRRLPRDASLLVTDRGQEIDASSHALRPRGLVFGFSSDFKSAESLDESFRHRLADVDDAYRPNGVCVMDQAFIWRTPYSTNTTVLTNHPLMMFFFFLVSTLRRFPPFQVDLRPYIGGWGSASPTETTNFSLARGE